MMVKPEKLPQFVKDLMAHANRGGVTAYRIAKEAGIPLSSAQRFLVGDINPTASTIEQIAKALGMVVKVERK